MAKENVAQAESREAAHEAARDAYESLSGKLMQLQSLLLMTYGNQREAFEDLADEWQDNYMWACHDMAADCAKLLEQVSPLYFPERGWPAKPETRG